jgi:hypothetical protein
MVLGVVWGTEAPIGGAERALEESLGHRGRGIIVRGLERRLPGNFLQKSQFHGKRYCISKKNSQRNFERLFLPAAYGTPRQTWAGMLGNAAVAHDGIHGSQLSR